LSQFNELELDLHGICLMFSTVVCHMASSCSGPKKLALRHLNVETLVMPLKGHVACWILWGFAGLVFFETKRRACIRDTPFKP